METERAGSVSAVPHPMAKEGDGEMWWESIDEEVVVGSCFVCTCEAGEGSWG